MGKDGAQEVRVLWRSFTDELGQQFRMVLKHQGAKNDFDSRQTLSFGGLSCVLELPNAIFKLPFLGFEPFDFLMMRDCGFHE